MSATNSVISGSTALAFVVRDQSWAPNDLDFYIPKGRMQDISSHLELEEGYAAKQREIKSEDGASDFYDDSDPEFTQICRVETMVKTGPRGISSIDIVESLSTNPIYTIASFHSTAVMNFITGTSVNVTYPHFTFNREAITHHERRSVRALKWVKKYEGRGFKIVNSPEELGRACGASCAKVYRTSNDKHNCKFGFTAYGLPSDEEVIWKLGISDADTKKRFEKYMAARCSNHWCPWFKCCCAKA